MNQNYFQYEVQIYLPQKGIAMGSPISRTMVEIYLQYLEESHTIKHDNTAHTPSANKQKPGYAATSTHFYQY
jgi:hypothetical protein